MAIADLIGASGAADAAAGWIGDVAAPAVGGALSGAGSWLGSALGSGWNLLSGSGGSALGGLLGGGASLEGTKLTNAQSQENLQSAENWMTMMSNTAYQRGTADMKAAGINPMLAYSQGGASAPSVSPAPVQNYLGSAVQGAISSASALKDLQAKDADIKLTQAQTVAADNQADINMAEARRRELQLMQESYERGQGVWDLNIERQKADIANAQQSYQQGLREIQSRDYSLRSERNDADFADSWVGRNIAPVLDTLGKTLNSAHSFGSLYGKAVAAIPPAPRLKSW